MTWAGTAVELGAVELGAVELDAVDSDAVNPLPGGAGKAPPVPRTAAPWTQPGLTFTVN